MSPVVHGQAPRLTVRRLPASEWVARLADDGHGPLGALGYGATAAEAGVADTGARRLWPDSPAVDAWCSTGALSQGRCGAVRWTHNGHWLHGALELDEATADESLETLARRAYRDIFATLAQTGCSHLLRLWNYLPGINADADGMERYRLFNSGRQLAFLDAGQAAFEGAPAACALGTRGGPLRIRFLAGRVAAVPVENPRQVSAYHYPSDYGPRSPTFSRAALLDCGGGQVALLISGTASIVGHQSVHVGNVQAQTRETLANLNSVIAAAQQRCSARFDLAAADCTVYVRRAADADSVRALFAAAVGPDSPAARSVVVLEADICRADLGVEIEAHAIAPGELIP